MSNSTAEAPHSHVNSATLHGTNAETAAYRTAIVTQDPTTTLSRQPFPSPRGLRFYGDLTSPGTILRRNRRKNDSCEQRSSGRRLARFTSAATRAAWSKLHQYDEPKAATSIGSGEDTRPGYASSSHGRPKSAAAVRASRRASRNSVTARSRLRELSAGDRWAPGASP